MNAARSDNQPFFERAVPAEVTIPKLLAGAALLGSALTAVGSIAPWFRVAPAPGLSARANTISGAFTDGTFTLVFALVALVALVAALVRPDSEGAAWIAFTALGLCAIIGLFDWMIYAEAEAIATANNLGEVQHVSWGLPLTALAGLGGSIATSMLARKINLY